MNDDLLKRFRIPVLAIVALLGVSPLPAAAQAPAQRPAPALATSVATFAGGCFWCMEEVYDKVPGVISTTSGYMGGKKRNPTYEEVSAGVTGHTEVVQVAYDPSKVSYEKLLEVFWRNIDPTVKDRQFCDSGSQYRTEIFVHNDEQRKAAEASKAARREDQAVQGADRHADHRGRRVLAGRGLSPGLSPTQSRALQVLQDRLRTRRAPEAALGQRCDSEKLAERARWK